MKRLQHPPALYRSPPFLIAMGLYAVLLTTMLVYWPGLDGGFLLDDLENLRPFVDLDEGRIGWREAVLSNSSGPLGRPLTMLTFAANVIASGMDTWSLKYTNLMIHLLCGALIAWLSGRLFHTLLPRQSPNRSWALALTVASLWLLAPLFVSTTLYIIQRLAQLVTLFSLAGLLSYTCGRQHLEHRPCLGWALIASSFLLWLPLALFSKENGALLPLLILVIEVFVFRFRGSLGTQRALYTLMLVSVGLPAIVAVLALTTTHPHLVDYTGRPFTLTERLLTEARVLFYYIGNLLIPQGPGMGIYHDDFVVSKGLLSPATTLVAVIGWAVFVSLLYTTRKRVWWALFLGPCFFLASHSLESSIFPLELVFEHRNYMAAFGVFFFVVHGLWLLSEKLKKPASVIWLLALLPAVYGFATYQRATTWSSWGHILLAAEEAHPSSMRVHVELANLYSTSGDIDKALEHLNQVKQLRDSATLPVALHGLLFYCKSGKSAPNDLYGQIPDKMPQDDASIYTVNVFRALVKEIATDKCPNLDIPRLLKHTEKLITHTETEGPKHTLWDLHYHIAYIQRAAGRMTAAIQHLKKADARDPSRPEALLTIIQYQMIAHDYAGGRQTLALLRERFPKPSPRHARLIANFTNIINAIEQPRSRNHHVTVN
jgi:protein O-mannosyl-transferase